MKLKPFVSSDRVVIGLQGAGRREVLEQLIAPLVLAPNLISDPEKFLDDLEAREEQVTTVMDNGVAFPHARSEAVTRLCLTVGLAGPAGIHFKEPSKTVSRLFFCLGVPAFAPTAHIPLLQTLANYARDPKRVERILQSKTASQAAHYLVIYKG